MRSADILDRLTETAVRVRNSGEWGELSDTLVEAKTEIELLRFTIRRLADHDATLSVCNGAVTVTMGGTLTDAERFVLREVRDIYADEDDVKCNEIAAVLDRLLERLG